MVSSNGTLEAPPKEIVLPGQAEETARRRRAARMVMIALDFSSFYDAQAVVDEFGDEVLYKMGMELNRALAAGVFTDCLDEDAAEEEQHEIPDRVLDTLIGARRLYRSLRGRFFADEKIIDIPPTVAGATTNVVRYAPFMFNVMALAGRPAIAEAVRANREQAERLGLAQRPLVIAVTVLTSLNLDDMRELGFAVPDTTSVTDPEVLAALKAETVQEQVVRLAKIAQEAGADGVVCSAQETAAVRAACGPDFKIVNPGLRLAVEPGAQKRTATPAEAVADGADYLVIGSEVTKAKDGRLAALRRVIDNILTVLP